MEKKELRERSIGEAIRSWSAKTTLRAISPIMNSKSSMTRALWTSFIVLFAFVLAQKLDQLVSDYLEFKAVTKIKLIENEIDEQSSPMLAIKFSNWINYASYLRKFRKTNITEDPNKFLFRNPLGPIEAFAEGKRSFLASLVIDESRIDPNDEWTQMQPLNTERLLNSIVSCQFNGVDCDIDDFELIEGRSDQAAYLRFKYRKSNSSFIFR